MVTSMEEDERFYFRAGKLYRINKFSSNHQWTPIYKHNDGRQVIGRLHQGGLFLFTGNVWIKNMQIIYEECIGWISIDYTTKAEEIREK